MADASPSPGRWAFRPLPPEPRSVVELIRAGTLDAQLAATLWLLIEARVPIVVAAEGHGAGKSTLLGALLDFLPPGIRTVELSGADETFDWLPQAAELGWSAPRGRWPAARDPPASRRRCPDRHRSSRRRPCWSPRSSRTICRRTPGAPRRGWPSAPSRWATASPRRSTPTRSRTCSRRWSARPCCSARTSCHGSAWSCSCGRSPTAGGGWSRRTTSARPPGTCTATCSASGPPCSRPGTRPATPSSTSAGGSRPSSRSASGAGPATSRWRRRSAATCWRPSPAAGVTDPDAVRLAIANHRHTDHPPTPASHAH